MATPQQIERQIKLETQAVHDGIQKLRDNTKKAEGNAYASSTVYAQRMLKEAIPAVAKEITRLRTNRLLRGAAGPALAPLVQYTLGIEPEVLAMLTLKTLFDVCTDPKDRADLVNNVIDRVGTAVEQEAKWRYFNEKDPELVGWITNSHHQGKGLHYRDYDATRRFREKGIYWTAWPRISRVKIGAAFAEAACQVTGWWHKQLKFAGRRSSVHLRPTPQMLDIIAGLMERAELFAPLNLPMLVEPNDWTNHQAGGYLTNEVRRGNKLIRTFGVLRLQGETPLAFLNHLQKVAYRINPFILEVANRLEEDSYKIEGAKFIPEDRRELPLKPHDIATNKEARFNYRKEAAAVYDFNSTSLKRSIRTKLTLSLARKFAKEERYYLPWSFDYRGRVYPIPSFLTPQDTGFAKSLIQFADGEPLSERGLYWLRFQLATTAGLDKASMEERQAWAHKNEGLFSRIATDPLGQLSQWETVEEPFLFLAACEEFHALVVAKSRSHTHLPVAVDATCSGLQVLAGLSHDRSTAALVNVSPGERPSDAYKAVANAVNPNLPKEWGIELTRSDVKRVVMTIPYNAKPLSNRSYIREALVKKRGLEITPEQLTLIVRLTRDAMREIVPGPMQVMDWLNKEIKAAIKRGLPHIEWTTPSGFNVKQDLRHIETERIKAHLMGEVKLSIGVSEGQPDLKHHANAGAPNLIHSLDASILQIGLREFATPFTVIHDSVLCLANHMDDLNAAVRSAYAQCFTEHSPLHDLAESIGAEHDPPMVYDFDPGTVSDSPYFFC
jgi:DNA-directed RNA polymerase